MKSLANGINPAIINDPISRRYWAIVREALNEWSAVGQGVIPAVNYPDGEDVGGGLNLNDYLYLPGRVGGQTVLGLDTSPTVTVRASGANLQVFPFKVTNSTDTLDLFSVYGYPVDDIVQIVVGDYSTTYPIMEIGYDVSGGYGFVHSGNAGGIKFLQTTGRVEFSAFNGLAYIAAFQSANAFTDLAATTKLELGHRAAELFFDQRAMICGYAGQPTPKLGISSSATILGNGNAGVLGVPTSIFEVVNYSGVGTVLTTMRGIAAQSGNMLEFRTNTGTLLSRVTSAGVWDGPISSAYSATFLDTLFRVQDNSDPTKQLAFECSTINTGTTRTVTIPDASGIMAYTNSAQTFTAPQTITPAGDTQPLAIIGTNVATANLFSITTSAAATAVLVDAAGVVNYATGLTVWSADIGTSNDCTFDASAVSATTVLTLPSISSTLAVLGGTQTFTGNKTFSGTTTISGLASVLRSSTATSGVRFADNSDTSKAFRVVLSGCSTGADNSLSFTSTTDRNYAFPNYGGTVPVTSDTPAANEVLRFTSGQEDWGAIDHNYMANRTRKVWFSFGDFLDPGTGTNGFDATVGSATSTMAAYHTVPSAGGSPISGYISIPNDYASGVIWTLYYAMDGTNANTMAIQCSLHIIAAGGTLNAAATSTATSNMIVAGVANQVSTGALSNSLTVAAGDLIRVTLQRDGADSNSDNGRLLGIMLEYTADM